MKEILLTQGYKAIVDDEDFEYLNKFKWSYIFTNKYSKTGYARTAIYDNGRKLDGKLRQRPVRMHRMILSATSGSVVDHIDGNGLNNQRKNLRICTVSQNLMNRSFMSNNKCKSKGVCKGYSRWITRNGEKIKKHTHYRANITKKGKTLAIGNFKTKEEAMLAYNEKAKELFGEFAYTNRPRELSTD